MKLTSTDAVSHIKITAAGLTALLVTVVGQLVAFVPSLASREQILISAGSTVIAAVFLVANAVHALAGSKATPALVGEPIMGELLSTSAVSPVTVNVHPPATTTATVAEEVAHAAATAVPPAPPAAAA